MLRHLRFPVLAALLLTATAGATPQRGDNDLVRAMDEWLAAFRKGQIDMRGWDVAAPRFSRGRLLGPITPMRDLQLLLDAAATDASPEAALRVLRIAGTGLDRLRHGHGQAPAMVRTMAERSLARMLSAPVKRLILEIARGAGVAAAREEGTRAAALRATGDVGGSYACATLVAALGEAQPGVRLAAVDGLRRLADLDSVAPLIAQLRSEPEDSVLIALAGALLDIFDAHPAAVPTRQLRDASHAVLDALGRTGWRARLSLLDFVGRFRNSEAVPVLIDLLVACNDKRARDPERVSGTLLARVHELLVDLTGTMLAADRPQDWRQFWAEQGAVFRVAASRPVAAEAQTVSQGFFGVAVCGTRVVFIIDVSMSMAEPYPKGTAGADGRVPTKFDVAKQELLAAIDGLPAEASFNIIAFSGEVARWQNDVVPATVANKASAARHVRRLDLASATDIWGGLQAGLQVKSLAHGERYASSVDEIFLLSDGWPTAGAILDPGQILAAIDDSNRFSRVRINTVFLGTAGDVALHARSGLPPSDWLRPEEMMAQLAAHNGGRHVRPR